MASAFATNVGVADARPGATPAGGLLDRTGKPLGVPVTMPTGGLLDSSGRPLHPAPVQIANRVAATVRRDGSPLFPNAPDPALVAMCDTYPADGPEWADAHPGPELARALAEVDSVHLADAHVVDLVRAHSRMIAQHEAIVMQVLADLASRPVFGQCTSPDDVAHTHDASRAAAEEVSLAMSWTQGFADARVSLAVELVHDLPDTLAALHAGLIDAYKAKVIADETRALADDPDRRHAVEAAALRVASDKTGPQLRAFAKRKVIKADPDAAEQRRQAARRNRNVSKPYPDDDGMAYMTVFGPVDDLAAIYTAIDSAARARKDVAAKSPNTSVDSSKSLDALRFDVLAELAWAALDAGHLGCCNPECPGTVQRTATAHGRAAHINVTVPITTLFGIDDEPADLDGFGPITAATARRIASDGTWRRLLTDSATGALLDYGTTRYTPPQDLADFVIARDKTCRWPTCTTPAASCDLDHTKSFTGNENGGSTSADDLGAFHRRHHFAKTHHSFAVDQHQPGSFVITTPTGKAYRVDPEAIGPVIDPKAETAHGPPGTLNSGDPGDDTPPF